jgi:hypothetical protein
MVGTGRIELPTSSVSRKRSPTELRACKAEQEWPEQVDLPRIEGIRQGLVRFYQRFHGGRAPIAPKQRKKSFL